ncbi:hypothetical protein NQT66_13405 [Cellulophaga baltica]|jgi:hypothetical protein|uniref:hypothetical protein n=1 Tax=Cellulophaga baltica TaxID=76594 RepID=UPI0021472509|nr:hypothetical protein [Cellulophaga baltica]MCR1025813.1 hypothetical protein [Cellulophaga baltica]
MRQIIIFILVLSAFSVSAQEEPILNFDILGYWSQSPIPSESKDVVVYTRSEPGRGSLIMNFRKSGVYRIYSTNLNGPNRCGNYIARRTDHWGKYEYNKDQETIDIYSYGGKFEYTWEVHQLGDDKIELVKNNRRRAY